MADRRRHQAEIGGALAHPVRVDALARSQRLHVRDRRGHMGPQHLGRFLVPGMTPELGCGERELSVAVVLGHGIRAACRSAARYLAVLELKRGEPEQEVAGDVFVTKPQQRRRRQRAITNPGSCVGSCARLQGRAAAVDEDVAEGGAQRAGDVDHFARAIDADPVDGGTPARRDTGFFAADVEPCRQRRGRDRQHDVDGPMLARSKAHVVAQHRVREAIGIADAQRPVHRRGLREPSADRPGRGRLDADAARRLHRLEAQRAIDPKGAAVPVHGLDRAGAAAMGEELRRRIRLKGPPGKGERETARPLAKVAHRVANHRLGIVGSAGAEGGDVQDEIADTPAGGRHGQVTVAQGVADAGVGPTRDSSVADQKRLESADPGTGSTAPSSLSSAATRPPSTPKTVQYDCSPM